jgi:hypothetical protein
MPDVRGNAATICLLPISVGLEFKELFMISSCLVKGMFAAVGTGILCLASVRTASAQSQTQYPITYQPLSGITQPLYASTNNPAGVSIASTSTGDVSTTGGNLYTNFPGSPTSPTVKSPSAYLVGGYGQTYYSYFTFNIGSLNLTHAIVGAPLSSPAGWNGAAVYIKDPGNTTSTTDPETLTLTGYVQNGSTGPTTGAEATTLYNATTIGSINIPSGIAVGNNSNPLAIDLNQAGVNLINQYAGISNEYLVIGGYLSNPDPIGDENTLFGNHLGTIQAVNLDLTLIPEPASISMMGMALLGMMLYFRRRRIQPVLVQPMRGAALA